MRSPSLAGGPARGVLAVAAGLALVLCASPALASAGAGGPRLTRLTCVERCAAQHAVAEGGLVRLFGRHLAGVTAVVFPGVAEPLSVEPASTDAKRVSARVPDGARSGRPRALAGDAVATAPDRLRVVPGAQLPPPASFRLVDAKAGPSEVFFDQPGGERLRFRFRSDRRLDVRVRVVRRGGEVVRAWTREGLSPFASHSLRWDGSMDGGGAPPGRYRFSIGRVGGRQHDAGSFRLRDYLFPLRGGHRYGDRFGVPRSGGRTHEGQDLWAACGTRLVAARGGEVQAVGYSAALYGHYVTIDGRDTRRDQFYAHMTSRVRVRDGERIHTGQTIGYVGATGNAAGEGCQLHFELWPRGWRNANPIDPLSELKRWDRYS